MKLDWIDIRVKEPPQGQRLIFIDMNWDREIKVGYWFSEENSFWEFNEIGIGSHNTATHWLPAALPLPKRIVCCPDCHQEYEEDW